MQRTAIYARVSTGRQVKEGESVQAQLKALHEYVESHDDLILVDEFVDEGISGQKAEERDELQRLLEYVKQDKIDLILFCKLDRFFRSMRYYVTTQELLDKHGVQWKTLWENHDTTTPQGRLIVSQMMSIAQFEAENTTQRIKAVFDYKITQGEVISGKQPIGFDIVDKRLVPNRDAIGIKRAFEVYASTGKLFKALDAFEEATGRRIAEARNMTTMLRNEKYAGRYRGNANYCEPIVDKDTFDMVQRILDARPTREVKYEYIFSGLMYCAECGKRMTVNGYTRPSKKFGKSVAHLYVCSDNRKRVPKCTNTKNISERKVEKYLLEHIEGYIESVYGKKTETDKETFVNTINDRIRSVNDKIKRLKNLYIIGDIEIDEYIEKKEEFEKELKECEEKLKEATEGTPNELTEAVLIGGVKMVYSGLHTTEEKKVFWASIIKRIWFDKDKNITIEL